jgi:hypothetical protein
MNGLFVLKLKKTGLCRQRSDPNRIRLGQRAQNRKGKKTTTNGTGRGDEEDDNEEEKMLICFK